MYLSVHMYMYICTHLISIVVVGNDSLVVIRLEERGEKEGGNEGRGSGKL